MDAAICRAVITRGVQLAFHTTDTVLVAVAACLLLRFPAVFTACAVPGGALCARASAHSANDFFQAISWLSLAIIMFTRL